MKPMTETPHRRRRFVRGFALTGLIAAIFGATMATSDPSDQFSSSWPKTDFSRATVPLDEFMSGGPPKDGIPALDTPAFIPASNETRLNDREPVMVYDPEGSPARAYPIRYLMWHEIVNDQIDGAPLLVTFCPLCNTGMIFDPVVGERTLTFGVSGLLRHSDMVMYDRQTESWWQQALGSAIVGEMTGQELTQLPALMLAWAEFRAEHPDGLVMDEPDWPRRYGTNPYVGYDTSIPFLYQGENPPHGIDPLARVVRVGDRAWPMDRLRELGTLDEAGLTLSWVSGQASALDAGDLGEGRDVGTVRVTDAAGAPVVFDIPFAFAFHALHPDGTWMLGGGGSSG